MLSPLPLALCLVGALCQRRMREQRRRRRSSDAGAKFASKALKGTDWTSVVCALLFLVFYVLAGMVYFVYMYSWEYLDAAYFCIVCITTVGYGDLYPTSFWGRIGAVIYIIIAVGAGGVAIGMDSLSSRGIPVFALRTRA